MIQKRLQNEKRDIRNVPDLGISYSRVSLGKVSSINKHPQPTMKKSGSVPSILGAGGHYSFREQDNPEKRVEILDRIDAN